MNREQKRKPLTHADLAKLRAAVLVDLKAFRADMDGRLVQMFAAYRERVMLPQMRRHRKRLMSLLRAERDKREAGEQLRGER